MAKKKKAAKAAKYTYPVSVSFTPHVTGTASPDVQFGGIPVPGWIYRLKARAVTISDVELTSRIEDLTWDDRVDEIKKVARWVLKGQSRVRITKSVGNSVNPNGGPPWKITSSGGNILLSVRYGGNHMTRFDYDWGISVAYYMEVMFG